ncbi:MAG: lipoprotein [Ferruginibacter sp.]|nr:lipoprotein [Ferruginibacter sp.]
MFTRRLFIFISLFFVFSTTVSAQKLNVPKYNALLWEISGNGLKKPSYLFGTMHVSNKLAFHLSDSFYYAMRKVDAVALELNPESWQAQMVRLNTLNENYTAYVQNGGNDFLTEKSFRIGKYDDILKAALSTEPPVVNSLLYRSYIAREDFEEDTFLDLYIFQTGRKLGKAPAGVEDYYESEKLVMEAYSDMAKEKKKKEIDLDGESMSSLVEKMQNAYRRGDLDLMDSLDLMMERSDAFREKFLYKRNEIQANSIDSIIRTRSLFAGVGAAHLPGERGVIEILRKKGYTLRPIKMSDRDATQKDLIDKLKVNVTFTTQHAPDGMYQVDVPGIMYSLRNAYLPLNRWQYADMNNGSYYLITRLKTYASFLDQSTNAVLSKIDSVLYENIPGRILSRREIEKDGYKGYDISNRTRRGDLQRYQVFVTPFEIIVFKMSGKNEYVAGEEGNRFFSSIRLRKIEKTPVSFMPAQGGFSIRLPQQPHQYLDKGIADRWEYEAKDSATGDAYLLMKKSNYNFNFIEEDSFDLGLVEESFRSPDFFDEQLSRRQTNIDGYPALLVRETLKNGEFVNAAYVLNGPHYYVIAQRTKNPSDSNFAVFKTLQFQPYKYPSSIMFVDTFLHISMNTPVQPNIDAGIRTIIEQNAADAGNGNNATGYITYWQKQKNGLFRSDSTGEMIAVQVQEYPKYFFIRDSAKFWQSEIDDYLDKNDMLLRNKTYLNLRNGLKGLSFSVQDTGSSRTIERLLLLKDKYMYTLSTMSDTVSRRSGFVNRLFNSFSPVIDNTSANLYENKLSLFFSDLFSADSALEKKARQSVANVYFGSEGATDLYKAINRISLSDKDYYQTKLSLIAELGYIKDSITDNVPNYLKSIYDLTADTTLFQNEAVLALSRLKTAAAYKILKEIMLQDPPIFEDDNDFSTLFSHLEDTLQLSAKMFPDLLKLATLSDYKEQVTELLVMLVDSGFVKAKEYKKYFPSIYIDAKVAQKKLQAKDEKQMQADKKNEDEADDENNSDYRYNNSNSNSFGLNDYAVLLMPFYEKDKNVEQFFTKLLLSKDAFVRMDAAILLLRNNKFVPDSIFSTLAADDKYFAWLFVKLEKAKLLNKLPAISATQLALARSFLVGESNANKIDSIVFLKKTSATLNGRTGMVYFFKYRIKKSDDWKIGVSGLQPVNEKELSSEVDLVVLTDKKIKEYEPLNDQLNLQLKKLLFGFHKSAKEFFSNDDYNYKSLGDYGD